MEQENKIILTRHDVEIAHIRSDLDDVKTDLNEVKRKLDRIQWWLIGLGGSMTTGAILLAVDIITRR